VDFQVKLTGIDTGGARSFKELKIFLSDMVGAD
jgi:hypothetical protein